VEGLVVLVIFGTVYGGLYKTRVVLTVEGFLVLVIPGKVVSMKGQEGILAVEVSTVGEMRGTLCAASIAFTGKLFWSLK
jgi:hypothetical protein